MARSPLLLLIGLRCSGKTTLGKATAQSLNLPCADLDPSVLAALGCSTVTEAFAFHGERGWRDAEAAAFRQALDASDIRVLSVGGGTPTTAGSAAAIRQGQQQGWLRVALLDPGQEELIKRLQASRGDRPTLASDPMDEVSRLAAERMPLFRSLADMVIDTREPLAACVQRLATLLTLNPDTAPSSPASESPQGRSRRAS